MRGSSTRLRRLCTGAIAAVALALLPAGASAGTTTIITGTTSDGPGMTSTYVIEVPSPWNGTLVLYSHGYSFTPSSATDAGDPVTHDWLLNNGYAIAGSSYSTPRVGAAAGLQGPDRSPRRVRQEQVRPPQAHHRVGPL